MENQNVDAIENAAGQAELISEIDANGNLGSKNGTKAVRIWSCGLGQPEFI